MSNPAYQIGPRKSSDSARAQAAGAPELRVLLSENLAPWLRRLQQFPALAQLPPLQRQWRLVWAQQFFIYLARQQISRPGPEQVEAFLAALSKDKTVRFPDQVTEAARLALASLEGARNQFAEAIKREGRHYSQRAREEKGNEEGRRQKAEGRTAEVQQAAGSKRVGSSSLVGPTPTARATMRAGVGEGVGEGVLGRMRAVLRTKHYSLRTEEAYLHWVRQLWKFHGRRTMASLGAQEVRAFIEHLALERNVAVSTQQQALNALVFLYDQVLETPLGNLGDWARAKRGQRVPTVLSKAEVGRVLEQTSGAYGVILRLIYGTGLRLMECLAPAGPRKRLRLTRLRR